MVRFIAILFLYCGYSVAQNPIYSASPQELIDKLSPQDGTSQTRGLRNLVPEKREIPSVDLMIQFEFDSANLLPNSLPILINLANAMTSDTLKNYTFIIEGHADAVGNPEYNQRLSKRRADSVTIFLSQNGVDKKRLKSLGKGSTQPLTPSQPSAPENRRVRVMNNL